MPGVIGRFITFLIFISLMLYLAGIYGVPVLGNAVLSHYGYTQASIGSANLHSNAIVLRNIHLATTENGDSGIDTLRIGFGYSTPYLRDLTIKNLDIHAEWTPGARPHLAGKPLSAANAGSQKPLTFSRLIQMARMPAWPFETIEIKQAGLVFHTPHGATTFKGRALMNAKREFTAQLNTDDAILDLDMSLKGSFNKNTGLLETLNANTETPALQHDTTKLADGQAKLTYRYDNATGERLTLTGRAGQLTYNNLKIANVRASIKDSRKGIDSKVEVDSIERNNMALKAISAQAGLSQLWPLATYDAGRFTINKVKLGFPVTNVDGTYRISNSTPKLFDLKADFANGRITIKPGKNARSYVLKAEKLGLDKLVEFSKVNGLSMKGEVSGQLPIRYNTDKGIIIDDGRISGGKGGYIHYEPETYPAALQGNNMGMATTRKALRRLNLSHLELKLNGPVQGDLEANLSVKGENPDFSDRPVHLKLNLSGALMRAVQQGLNISFGAPTLDAIKQQIEK